MMPSLLLAYLQNPSPDPPTATSLGDWVREHLGQTLTGQIFILENWQWVGLVVLVVLGTVAGSIASLLVGRALSRLSKRRQANIRKESLIGFERPLGITLTAAVFLALLPFLDLDPSVGNIVDIAGSFVLTVTGVWSAFRLVDVLGDFLTAKALATDNKFDDMLVPLLVRTLKIVVFIVGLVFIASRLTEQVWSILAGISLGSLAVGFAAKDSIENLFGTFTVLLDKPFELGDWITVGSIDGTVEAVGIRSTRVRTFYNSLISVPNSTFISAHVDNMGSRRYRRIKTTLTLTYDTPPAKVEAFCEGVRELIRTHPYTRKDYFHVYLNDFSASSIDVMLYCFVETPDWATELRERHRLLADILRLAESLQVEFAFPTQTLHMTQVDLPTHSNTPPDVAEAGELGRGAAHDIVREGLAPWDGGVPPPVSAP
jgi:MscS family membrane protein